MHAHDLHRNRLPHPHEMSHADFEMVVRHLADDLAFGTDESLFVGSGLEYAQSRPYEPGDPVKQIDWKITARTGHAYLKQYETLKRTTLYLVVDTSASMSATSTRLSKHELAVWMASAIGLVGLRRLSPVAVVSAGQRKTRMEPSLAPASLWQAIEPLREQGVDEQTVLGERLSALDPQLDRRSLLVVISDLHDPAAVQGLKRMGQRHDVVVLHLEDPAERGGLRAGFFRGGEAETGRTFLAGGRTRWPRDEQLAHQLAAANVSYLHLFTDRPFLTAVRQFLSSRAVLMRGRG